MEDIGKISLYVSLIIITISYIYWENRTKDMNEEESSKELMYFSIFLLIGLVNFTVTNGLSNNMFVVLTPKIIFFLVGYLFYFE